MLQCLFSISIPSGNVSGLSWSSVNFKFWCLEFPKIVGLFFFLNDPINSLFNLFPP